jgi:hypothetical protein
MMVISNMEDCIKFLKETDKQNQSIIEYLRKENEKLKNEHYKDEELQKMKEQLEIAKADLRRGFPITESENKKLNDWMDKHLKEKHWDTHHNCCKSFGAAGGAFTFEFLPTGLGVFKTVKCTCGAKFDFGEDV